jgi:hypothetical protein
VGCISSSYAGVTLLKSLSRVWQIWQILSHFLQSPLEHAGLESEAASPRLFPVRTTKVYRWSGGIFPLILNVGTRLKWVFNITSRPPCLRDRAIVPIKYETWWVPENSGQHTKKNISLFFRDSIPRSSSTLRSHCTGYDVPARSGALPHIFFHIRVHYHLHFSAIECELRTASPNKGQMSKMFHLPSFPLPLSTKGFSWKYHVPFAMPISVVITINFKNSLCYFLVLEALCAAVY